jgi:hypothetical protein
MIRKIALGVLLGNILCALLAFLVLSMVESRNEAKRTADEAEASLAVVEHMYGNGD